MNFDKKNVLAFLLIAILPYGNITKFLGIEDGGSRLLIPIILAIVLFRVKKTFESVPFFILLILLSLVTLYQSIRGFIPWEIAAGNFLKFLTLFLLVGKRKHLLVIFEIFLSKYSKAFLASVFLSLITYVFYRKPEFIFYDGSSMRFGGFHFELFNMVYSSVIFYISWRINGFNRKLGFFLLFILLLLSKSNIVLLYLFIFLFSFYLSDFILHSKKRFFLITTSIVLSPVLMGLFLSELEFLNIFSLRSTTSFSHSGSSLFVRLYPFKLATDYLLQEPIIWSFLPRGIGFFESTNLIENDPFSYTGTGSPKALIDIGFICFMIIIVKLSKSIFPFLKFGSSENKSDYIFLYLSSLVFISFGAGFFNFVAWFILIALSCKFRQLTNSKNNL